MARRLAALLALVLSAAALGLALAVAIDNFPRGLSVLACLIVGAAAAWWAFVHAGPARLAGIVVAALALAGAVALIALEGRPGEDVLVAAAFVLALAASGRALVPHVELEPAPRPERPVLFYNPKSGGGKAERFHVADEARARGIEPVELKLGDNLRELVRQAIAGGADALAMAGGDGSQAVVADEAAAHGLPYACIPSGTRNHFALDLGVDRDDVVGALDAFVDGGERLVDLAEVNGRVFVNNVSLGVYAEAVQREEYRGSKLRTIATTAPEVLGPHGEGLHMSWTGPDGREAAAGAALLVSNGPYRLGPKLGSGTRPSLDSGLLGIAVVGGGNGTGRGLVQWSAEAFEVTSDREVPAGIDGEAVRLEPPLLFTTRPRALRVRIARRHPGASPSALLPPTAFAATRALLRLAFGSADR